MIKVDGPHSRGVHCTKLVRVQVHKRGIDLDLAVLRIHTIDTFRTEKYSRILTFEHIFKTEYICIQRYLDI